MALQHIFSFLVHPRKGETETRDNAGVELRHTGKLFEILSNVYARSPVDCDTSIDFRSDEDGNQQNDCRDIMVEFASRPNIANARSLAHRLEGHTDRRSGLGLLFIFKGIESHSHRVILSRFPTDEAILAEENVGGLSVEYLERVFLKNKSSYKAVIYEDRSIRDGMWSGRAIDRQNSDRGIAFSSNYWIEDFLLSELSMTARRGTRNFAMVLRSAATKADAQTRRDIVAAATLATGLHGQRISIEAFGRQFNLSDPVKDAIQKECRPDSVYNERFRMDAAEFRQHIGFRSVELDNGGIMTAPAGDFDDIFRQQNLGRSRQIRFTTEGTIVGQKLQKSSRNIPRREV